MFGIGSVSVLGQVVLFREWMVAGYGVELICVLALGAWLLLNAAGVFLAASGRGPNLSAALFLAGFGIVADMVFIRSLRNLAGLPPGTYLPLSVFIPAVVASLLPLCLFLGAAFQRAADLGMRHGRTLARAYAVECCGQRIRGPAFRPDAVLGHSEHGPGHCLRGHYDCEPRSWPWSKSRDKARRPIGLCLEMAFCGHIPDCPDGSFR